MDIDNINELRLAQRDIDFDFGKRAAEGERVAADLICGLRRDMLGAVGRVLGVFGNIGQRRKRRCRRG